MRNPFSTKKVGASQTEVAPTAEQQYYDAYAAPRGDAPYLDSPSGGWSPTLRVSATGEPDASRLGIQPRRDYRPDPVRPPDEFWQIIDRDKEARYSGETQVAVGWSEHKGIGSETRFAPNPRSVPPPETRLTQQMSPANYEYVRPFDQLNRVYGDAVVGTARHLNGLHFSMADHRRDYAAELYGMAPQRKPGAGTRNTYRLDPGPWDVEVVDKPFAVPMTTPPISAGYQSPDLPAPSGNRSWRLTG